MNYDQSSAFEGRGALSLPTGCGRYLLRRRFERGRRIPDSVIWRTQQSRNPVRRALGTGRKQMPTQKGVAATFVGRGFFAGDAAAFGMFVTCAHRTCRLTCTSVELILRACLRPRCGPADLPAP